MVGINKGRVLLGTLVGGIVWNAWSMLIGVTALFSRYEEAQASGQFLERPRYAAFPVLWILTLFVLAWIVSFLYAAARGTCGPGPRTALVIGVLVGLAAGFPGNLGLAAWSPIDRAFPLWWMIDLWGGAILATLAAAWLYKEKN